jgi:hypothetical protein
MVSMELLVPDESYAPAARVADDLRQIGHVVHTCHRPTDLGWACTALRGHPCPIERAPIDAVVVVRRGLGRPTLPEDGARCGLRHHIPLVIAGPIGEVPFEDRAALSCDLDDVGLAVEILARRPLPDHTTIAGAELARVLTMHGLDAAAASCAVYRRSGRLVVEVRADAPLPPDVARVVAIRIPARLRELDGWAFGIDLSVVSPQAAPTGG